VTTRKNRELQLAFVVDARFLRDLDGFLQRIADDRAYVILLSDSSSNDYASVDDLLGFPNTRARRILELSAATDSRPGGLSAAIRFSDKGTVEYKIEGEEKDVLHNSRVLEDLISPIRQWYSSVARFNFWSPLVGAYVGAVTALLLGVLLAALFEPELLTARLAPMRVSARVVVFALAVLFVVPPVLNGLRSLVLPRAEFAIGQGEDRHNTTVLWRRTVLGTGIITSVAAGLLVALLTK
jgi:hypothetical protein